LPITGFEPRRGVEQSPLLSYLRNSADRQVVNGAIAHQGRTILPRHSGEMVITTLRLVSTGSTPHLSHTKSVADARIDERGQVEEIRELSRAPRSGREPAKHFVPYRLRRFLVADDDYLRFSGRRPSQARGVERVAEADERAMALRDAAFLAGGTEEVGATLRSRERDRQTITSREIDITNTYRRRHSREERQRRMISFAPDNGRRRDAIIGGACSTRAARAHAARS